jgi:hypothetical protein
MTDAISHWSALGRWSPKFFKHEYGHLEIELDGETMALGALIGPHRGVHRRQPGPVFA